VQRVLVLGRGGAGKSTFARRLSEVLGIHAVELDAHFWSPTLQPPAPADWAEAQALLVAGDRWILDGDLGPYDVLEARLGRADTVVVLDFSLPRCAWRAARRSREAADFWRWVWHYRRRSRPRIREALRRHAPGATVHWLTTPRQARRLLQQVAWGR
jgi:adenylate kinase family enzyme